MINAIKANTKKMPHTIPALKIPDTTEQLPKEKAIKQTSEKTNNLMPFLFLYFKKKKNVLAILPIEEKKSRYIWLPS